MIIDQKSGKTLVKVALLSFFVIQIHCTTIGFHRGAIRKKIDFGNKETLRLRMT
ncbi:hypothetical protein [Leptospira alexanderi]|uniref:hypothetical protein n=1 Tax=Leptospira alexanderi TaxID=100053 RepID=UPI00031BBC22|nr:hypothetical protein [Leptospira alexanderi]